jgi:hypothetical protein
MPSGYFMIQPGLTFSKTGNGQINAAMRSICVAIVGVENKHILNTKVPEIKICVSIFTTDVSAIFVTLRIIQRHIVINVKTFLCKVPVIIVKF